MTRKNYHLLCLMILTVSKNSCGQPSSTKEKNKADLEAYRYSKGAEISSHSINPVRYRKVHKEKAVLANVTEPFSLVKNTHL